MTKQAKERVSHGTKKEANTSKAYWLSKNIGFIVDQLSLRGWHYPKTKKRYE